MSQIPFTVSARTAKLIGLENFSNAEGAIIELVKNTYDADSQYCFILFENIGTLNATIYIIDFGCGMNDTTIQNCWMTIGTDDKLFNIKSDNGRIKTGAKGIGRFALNRLGNYTTMYTVPEKSDIGYKWTVDWSYFDKPGITVSDIYASINNIDPKDVKSKIYHLIEEKKIIKEIPPFQNGTVLEITQLNDVWDIEAIKSLSANLEILVPPFNTEEFSIFLYSPFTDLKGKINKSESDDYDYKISSSYKADKAQTLIINITRNELVTSALEQEYKELFKYETMQKYPYTLEDFKHKTITIETQLNKLKGFSNIDHSLLDKIGKFHFDFYFIKNTISDNIGEDNLQKYPYKTFQSSVRKNWLKKNGGIKIFRDNFRVRPYGENGQDWLKLGERQAQSPGGAGQKLGGYRIRPNQIAGAVQISRIDNPYFQDKSSREGLQENDVFSLFSNIIIEIISFFEKDRNTIMYYLSQLYELKNPKGVARKKADALIKNDSESSDSPQEDIDSLKEGYKVATEELEEKDNELRMLRNLASTGLIISSFAHELKSLAGILSSRTNDLSTVLHQYLTEEQMKGIIKFENPFYLLEIIQKEDRNIKHWLDFALNSLRKDKRKRKKIILSTYFDLFKSTWIAAATDSNISIELHNLEENNLTSIKAHEVDLDTIFNNLLTNAFYSIKEKKDKVNRRLDIKCVVEDDLVHIIFQDTGLGLAEEYKHNPEEIFNSFESSKKDRLGKQIGTGLGLYIVKSIISEYNNSAIRIVRDIEDGFAIQITFKKAD